MSSEGNGMAKSKTLGAGRVFVDFVGLLDGLGALVNHPVGFSGIMFEL
jgi:hypothetical protein